MTRLVHPGDGIRWMNRFADRSVDLVVADPPYSEHTHTKSKAAPSDLRNPSAGGAARKTVRARDLGFASLTSDLADGYARAAARIASRWVLTFCDDALIGMWRALLEDVGLEVVRTCPWIKPNCAPQFTGDRPGAGWEAIIVAHQTRSRGRPMQKRWNGGGHRGVFAYDVPKSAGERVHSTQKPDGLMIELLSLFSDEGGLVVDPFAGSGTTGVAASLTGRLFQGAELDKKMAALAEERIAAAATGSTLAARRRSQLPMFPDAPAPLRWTPEMVAAAMGAEA